MEQVSKKFNFKLEKKVNLTNQSTDILYKYFVFLFFYIILEGALRKWLLPKLNIEIILFRDLFIIYVILISFKNKIFNSTSNIENVLLLWTVLVVIWSIIQLIINDLNLTNILAGLRFWVLYFWLSIVIFRTIENKPNLEKLIKIINFSILPMSILIIIQHYSSVDSFVNKQIGENNYIYQVVPGIVRTSGTFSFTYGFAQYIAFLTPLILYQISDKDINKLYKLILGLSLLICVIFSGSRAVFLQFFFIIIIYLFFLPKIKTNIINIFILFIFSLTIIYIFSSPIEAIFNRFNTASDKNLIFQRIVQTIFGEKQTWENFSIFGKGIALTSNFSNFSINKIFYLGENESDRIILGGGILGIIFLLSKYFFVIYLLFKNILVKKKNTLKLLFSLYFIIQILTQNITSQVTSHAFTFYALGILIAIINENNFNRKL